MDEPEGRPPVEERVAELRAGGKKDDEIALILFDEGYPTGEIMKHGLPRGRGEHPETSETPEEEAPSEERPPFEERLEELEAEGLSKDDICRTLVLEDYHSTLLVSKFGGRYAKIKRQIEEEKGKEEAPLLGAIAGPAKGSGWLDEVKDMIRHQIGRSGELTEVFSDVGLGVLLASLHKAGLKTDDFRRIALRGEGLREALEEAGETAFKALEYYQSDLVSKVEEERNEARAYASILSAQVKELMRQLNPKVELKSLMDSYILSGGVDDKILTTLIDKWLSIEVGEIKWGVVR